METLGFSGKPNTTNDPPEEFFMAPTTKRKDFGCQMGVSFLGETPPRGLRFSFWFPFKPPPNKNNGFPSTRPPPPPPRQKKHGAPPKKKSNQKNNNHGQPKKAPAPLSFFSMSARVEVKVSENSASCPVSATCTGVAS